MNTVNSDNFNQTCKGYVKRALDECKTFTQEQKDEVRRKLLYAFDMMTMQDARDYEDGRY